MAKRTDNRRLFIDTARILHAIETANYLQSRELSQAASVARATLIRQAFPDIKEVYNVSERASSFWYSVAGGGYPYALRVPVIVGDQFATSTATSTRKPLVRRYLTIRERNGEQVATAVTPKASNIATAPGWLYIPEAVLWISYEIVARIVAENTEDAKFIKQELDPEVTQRAIRFVQSLKSAGVDGDDNVLSDPARYDYILRGTLRATGVDGATVTLQPVRVSSRDDIHDAVGQFEQAGVYLYFIRVRDDPESETTTRGFYKNIYTYECSVRGNTDAQCRITLTNSLYVDIDVFPFGGGATPSSKAEDSGYEQVKEDKGDERNERGTVEKEGGEEDGEGEEGNEEGNEQAGGGVEQETEEAQDDDLLKEIMDTIEESRRELQAQDAREKSTRLIDYFTRVIRWYRARRKRKVEVPVVRWQGRDYDATPTEEYPPILSTVCWSSIADLFTVPPETQQLAARLDENHALVWAYGWEPRLAAAVSYYPASDAQVRDWKTDLVTATLQKSGYQQLQPPHTRWSLHLYRWYPGEEGQQLYGVRCLQCFMLDPANGRGDLSGELRVFTSTLREARPIDRKAVLPAALGERTAGGRPVVLVRSSYPPSLQAGEYPTSSLHWHTARDQGVRPALYRHPRVEGACPVFLGGWLMAEYVMLRAPDRIFDIDENLLTDDDRRLEKAGVDVAFLSAEGHVGRARRRRLTASPAVACLWYTLLSLTRARYRVDELYEQSRFAPPEERLEVVISNLFRHAQQRVAIVNGLGPATPQPTDEALALWLDALLRENLLPRYQPYYQTLALSTQSLDGNEPYAVWYRRIPSALANAALEYFLRTRVRPEQVATFAYPDEQQRTLWYYVLWLDRTGQLEDMSPALTMHGAPLLDTRWQPHRVEWVATEGRTLARFDPSTPSPWGSLYWKHRRPYAQALKTRIADVQAYYQYAYQENLLQLHLALRMEAASAALTTTQGDSQNVSYLAFPSPEMSMDEVTARLQQAQRDLLRCVAAILEAHITERRGARDKITPGVARTSLLTLTRAMRTVSPAAEAETAAWAHAFIRAYGDAVKNGTATEAEVPAPAPPSVTGLFELDFLRAVRSVEDWMHLIVALTSPSRTVLRAVDRTTRILAARLSETISHLDEAMWPPAEEAAGVWFGDVATRVSVPRLVYRAELARVHALTIMKSPNPRETLALHLRALDSLPRTDVFVPLSGRV